jgi:hypothetical protein
LSNIDLKISLEVPRFIFKPVFMDFSFKFPNISEINFNINQLDSLKDFKLLPNAPNLPNLPKLPRIKIIKFPHILPPPPIFPKIPDWLKDFNKVLKAVLTLYCLIFEKLLFVYPESDLKAVIE